MVVRSGHFCMAAVVMELEGVHRAMEDDLHVVAGQ
jgi:hypothetical protein